MLHIRHVGNGSFASVALVLLSVIPAFGWKCVPGANDICSRIATSDAVFIGVVRSIEPDVFGWATSANRRLGVPDAFEANIPFDDLRAAFLAVVPEPYRSQIAATKTKEEFTAWTDDVSSRLRARFSVDEVFRGTVESNVYVKVDMGGCGPFYARGETFLVFASAGDDGLLESPMCSGSMPLGAATGETLAYLHMLKHGGTHTARVYGWVTESDKDAEKALMFGTASAPVKFVDVMLRSGNDSVRQTGTDGNGRFMIDRLAEGDYELSVLAQDGTAVVRKTVRVRQGQCVGSILVRH